MRLEFVDHKVTDNGIILHFISLDPGSAKDTDVYVPLTDDEVTGDARTDLETVTTRLQRRLKPTPAADALIGETFLGLDRKLVVHSYETTDSGIRFRLVSPDPPGGEPSDYFVELRHEDLAGDSKIDAITVRTEIERKLKPSVFSEKLLSFSGWSVEI